MTKKLTIGLVTLLAMAPLAPAQYSGWQHSGSIFLLTTPDGANLPATVSETNFPVLVRLDKDWFDFSQTKANGDDIRFSANDGSPLPYEIEEWDATNGTASIWVRVPVIKGNARQEIRLHWGKADAAGESSGKAVFNESNGYLCVLHMSEPVKDEVGTLEPKDTGTTSSSGILGKSRRLDVGKGINCGEKITALPAGSSPHSSEVWFKAVKSNVNPLGWGNEQAQGKVVMQFASPPHISMDCYFSGGNVAGGSAIPLSQWVHVVHTYTEGEARIYVNGVLDGINTSRGAPLNIRTPARMYVGGWYNNFQFVGDIDEVRISKVVRSADWIRLQYENQKPMQALAGSLVQPGTDFSVSEKKLTLLESRSATVTAKAGGAQKVYWIVRRGTNDTIAAADRFQFTIEAGRVSGDQSFVLQFKAVYPDTVKTIDIPVVVQENVPDPAFTLSAPAQWDGRKTIEVVPHITNEKEMKAKGAGDLCCKWNVAGLATIRDVQPGKLVLTRAQNSGTMVVTATLSNGGKPVAQSIRVAVQEPRKDAWVTRSPGENEKPVDNQLYARDDRNEGTLYYNGALGDTIAEAAILKVYAGGKLFKTDTQKLSTDRRYAFTVKLKPGLIKYKVVFAIRTGGSETVLNTVTNIVCGDAYLIDGQSNAVSTDWGPGDNPVTNEWVRSFGSMGGDVSKGWGSAVRRRGAWEIGYWGMDLAMHLVEAEKIPVCIINGAAGGTLIEAHQRNPANPADPETIYGRLLNRVEKAGLTHGIRGVFWHQGENNQGTQGATGGYGWETYEQYFVDMSAAWKQDYPNIQHYYVFQIWPNSCSMGGTRHSDRLRDVQRRLPRLYSNMSVMSTLGVKPPGGCHYPPAGYAEIARLISRLVERDNYGKSFDHPITAPDVKRAYYTSDRRDEIALEFDQPMAWSDTLSSQFYLDEEEQQVVSGAASGNVLTLKLAAPAAAKTITYLADRRWSPDNLLCGKNGIAALTFCEVGIAGRKQTR